MRRFDSSIALVLVFTVLALACASCAGQFSLTKKLYSWNTSINKWLGSFLLFLFIVIPVYGICLLVDWIVLNVIEFYSGKNPITKTTDLQSRSTTVDGKKVTMTFQPGQGINVDITSIDEDGIVKTMIVRTTDDGLTARVIENGESSKMTAALNENGEIDRCVDGECKTIDEDAQLAVLDQVDGVGGLLEYAN